MAVLYTLSAYDVKDPNLVLESVVLSDTRARPVNPTAFHSVRVGVRSGALTTWFASWNQRTASLAEGAGRELFTDVAGFRRLKVGSELVVEVSKVGSPPTLVGCKVQLGMRRVGGSSGGLRPLFSVPEGSDEAVEALVRQLNASGLADVSVSVALSDG